MAVVTCVECDEEIELSSRPRLGQTVVCIACRARLEVVSTNPVEVDWADDDEWDDDFDDENFADDDFADDDDLDYDDDLEDDLEDELEDGATHDWR